MFWSPDQQLNFLLFAKKIKDAYNDNIKNVKLKPVEEVESDFAYHARALGQ